MCRVKVDELGELVENVVKRTMATTIAKEAEKKKILEEGLITSFGAKYRI